MRVESKGLVIKESELLGQVVPARMESSAITNTSIDRKTTSQVNDKRKAADHSGCALPTTQDQSEGNSLAELYKEILN